MQILAMGFVLDEGSYLRDSFNKLDFVVVVSSLLQSIPGVPNVSALRALRVLRPLRTLSRIKGMRMMVTSLMTALPELANVGILIGFLFVLFAIVMVQLFPGQTAGRCRMTPSPVSVPASHLQQWSSHSDLALLPWTAAGQWQGLDSPFAPQPPFLAVNDSALPAYAYRQPLYFEVQDCYADGGRTSNLYYVSYPTAVHYMMQLNGNRTAFPWCGAGEPADPSTPFSDPDTKANSIITVPSGAAAGNHSVWSSATGIPVTDPAWGQDTSPWIEPRTCVWPQDQQLQSVCDAQGPGGGGDFHCDRPGFVPTFTGSWSDALSINTSAPASDAGASVQASFLNGVPRTCGSPFDDFGNPRFLDTVMREAEYGGYLGQQSVLGGLANADSFPSALLLVFQIATEEGWITSLYAFMDGYSGVAAAVVFVLVIISIPWVAMELLLAVIWTNFNAAQEAEKEVIRIRNAKIRAIKAAEKAERRREAMIDSLLTDIETNGPVVKSNLQHIRRPSMSVVPGDALACATGTPWLHPPPRALPMIHNHRGRSGIASHRSRGSDRSRVLSPGSIGGGGGDRSSVLSGGSHRTGVSSGGTSYADGSSVADSERLHPASIASGSHMWADTASRRGSVNSLSTSGAGAVDRHFDMPPGVPTTLRLRMFVLKLVASAAWSVGTLLLILLNTVVLCLDSYPADPATQSAAEIISFALTLTFGTEMMLKLFALGFRSYCMDRFNLFDAAVVLMSLVDVSLSPPSFIASAQDAHSSGITAFRIFRLSRLFKLARSWTSLRVLLKSIRESISDIANYGLLIILYVFIMALCGMQLFAGKWRFDPRSGVAMVPSNPRYWDADVLASLPYTNYDTLSNAMLAIFELFTLEDWTTQWVCAWKSSGALGVTFLCASISLSAYCLVSLFEAIVLGHFDGLDSSKLDDKSGGTSGSTTARSRGSLTSGTMDGLSQSAHGGADTASRAGSHIHGAASQRSRQSASSRQQLRSTNESSPRPRESCAPPDIRAPGMARGSARTPRDSGFLGTADAIIGPRAGCITDTGTPGVDSPYVDGVGSDRINTQASAVHSQASAKSRTHTGDGMIYNETHTPISARSHRSQSEPPMGLGGVTPRSARSSGRMGTDDGGILPSSGMFRHSSFRTNATRRTTVTTASGSTRHSRAFRRRVRKWRKVYASIMLRIDARIEAVNRLLNTLRDGHAAHALMALRKHVTTVYGQPAVSNAILLSSLTLDRVASGAASGPAAPVSAVKSPMPSLLLSPKIIATNLISKAVSILSPKQHGVDSASAGRHATNAGPRPRRWSRVGGGTPSSALSPVTSPGGAAGAPVRAAARSAMKGSRAAAVISIRSPGQAGDGAGAAPFSPEALSSAGRDSVASGFSPISYAAVGDAALPAAAVVVSVPNGSIASAEPIVANGVPAVPPSPSSRPVIPKLSPKPRDSLAAKQRRHSAFAPDASGNAEQVYRSSNMGQATTGAAAPTTTASHARPAASPLLHSPVATAGHSVGPAVSRQLSPSCKHQGIAAAVPPSLAAAITASPVSSTAIARPGMSLTHAGAAAGLSSHRSLDSVDSAPRSTAGLSKLSSWDTRSSGGGGDVGAAGGGYSGASSSSGSSGDYDDDEDDEIVDDTGACADGRRLEEDGLLSALGHVEMHGHLHHRHHGARKGKATHRFAGVVDFLLRCFCCCLMRNGADGSAASAAASGRRRRKRKAVASEGTRTLFLFTETHPIRHACVAMMSSPWFERVILCAIIVSSIALAIDTPLTDPNSTLAFFLGNMDIAFTILFTAEMVIKLVSVGMVMGPGSYLRSGWNMLDCLIVCASILSLATDGNPTFRSLRSLRVLRALRPLRIISRNPSLRLAVTALFRAGKPILNVLLVTGMFYLAFAILAVSFLKGGFGACQGPAFSSLSWEQQDLVTNPIPFSQLTARQATWGSAACTSDPALACVAGHGYGNPGFGDDTAPTSRVVCSWFGAQWSNVQPQTFDNIVSALGTWYQLASTEQWIAVMTASVASRGIDMQPVPWSNGPIAFLFVGFILIGAWFGLNLLVAVIVDEFEKAREELGDNYLLTPAQKEWVKLQEVLLVVRPKRQAKPPKSNRCGRRSVFVLVTCDAWDTISLLAIVGNTVVLAMPYFGMSQSYADALDTVNTTFTGFFTLELLLKVYGLGYPSYWADTWNRFDCAVVVSSLIGLLVSKSQHSSIGALGTLGRTLRIVRVVRLVRSLTSLRHMLSTLLMILPSLANISALLLLLMFIFAIAGMQLFGQVKYGQYLQDRHANFRTLGNALLLQIRFLTGESWNMLMYDAMNTGDCNPDPPWDEPVPSGCGTSLAAAYFYTMLLLIDYTTFSLLVAVILQAFSAAAEEDTGRVSQHDLDRFASLWTSFDPEATLFLSTARLRHFLALLPRPMGMAGIETPTPEETSAFVASLRLPIYAGGFVHFSDVCLACTRRVVAAAAEERGARLAEVPNTHAIAKMWERARQAASQLQTDWSIQHYVGAEAIYETFRVFKLRRGLAL